MWHLDEWRSEKKPTTAWCVFHKAMALRGGDASFQIVKIKRIFQSCEKWVRVVFSNENPFDFLSFHIPRLNSNRPSYAKRCHAWKILSSSIVCVRGGYLVESVKHTHTHTHTWEGTNTSTVYKPATQSNYSIGLLKICFFWYRDIWLWRYARM